MDGAPGSGYPFPVKLDGFIVCLAGFPKVQGQSPKAGSSLRSEWKKEKQRKRLDINGATTATTGKVPVAKHGGCTLHSLRWRNHHT